MTCALTPQIPSQTLTAPTVLVVEDEVIIRLCTAGALEDAGFCVLEAGSSAEALEVLDRHPEIAVLVSDVRMPGVMDGLELVAQLTRDRPGICALVVSGNTLPEEAFQAGARGFIGKPYEPERVVEEVLRLFPHGCTPLAA